MASILDLFKTEHVEQADVPQEEPSFHFLSTEAVRPSLTEIVPEGQPGEITDEKYPWIQGLFNKSVPSKEYFETNALLAQIVDILQANRQNTVPTDFLHVKREILNASETRTFAVEDISPFGYIFIPSMLEAGNTSTFAPVNFYHGYSTGTPLIMRHESHAHLSLVLPNMDVITIQATNTNAVDKKTFVYYLSTRPIMVGSGQTNI
jgi:hypothetical protein